MTSDLCEQGEPGLMGERGTPGPKGIEGAAADQGRKGEPGLKGQPVSVHCSSSFLECRDDVKVVFVCVHTVLKGNTHESL